MILWVREEMKDRTRGEDVSSGRLFSYVDPESRAPAKRPLRLICAVVNDVLWSVSGEFGCLYLGTGSLGRLCQTKSA